MREGGYQDGQVLGDPYGGPVQRDPRDTMALRDESNFVYKSPMRQDPGQGETHLNFTQ